MRFRLQIEKQLIQAGWVPGRQLEFDIPADWKIPGNGLPGAVAAILSEFSGVCISSVPVDEKPRSVDYAGNIEIVASDHWVDLECAEALQKILGGSWFSIGNVEGIDPILVNEQGWIVLASRVLEYYDSSFDGFLDKILTGEKRETCPETLLPGRWPTPSSVD